MDQLWVPLEIQEKPRDPRLSPVLEAGGNRWELFVIEECHNRVSAQLRHQGEGKDQGHGGQPQKRALTDGMLRFRQPERQRKQEADHKSTYDPAGMGRIVYIFEG